MDLTVIVPCFNEAQILEASVARLVQTLRGLRWKSEIIFVDDMSLDETRPLLERVSRTYEGQVEMRVLLHPRNLGRGAAVMTGCHAARGRYAGFLDIDLEVDCNYIPAMIEALEAGADLVIGERFYDLRDVHPSRVVLSRGYRMLSRAVLRHPVWDSESGYKFFRVDRLAPVLERTREQGWFWDTEVVSLAHLAGLRIEAIPVRFIRRPEKRSTVRPLRDSMDYLYRLARFWWRLHREHGEGP